MAYAHYLAEKARTRSRKLKTNVIHLKEEKKSIRGKKNSVYLHILHERSWKTRYFLSGKDERKGHYFSFLGVKNASILILR